MGAIDVDVVVVEGDHDKVLDITTGSGTTSMTVGVEVVELIGLNTALNFDLYIDGAVTKADVIEIRLESGPLHAGIQALEYCGYCSRHMG